MSLRGRSCSELPSSSSLSGFGFEGLGIDSIMGMGPLGMGLSAASSLGLDSRSERSFLADRSAVNTSASSRLASNNDFGLSLPSGGAKRHSDLTTSSTGLNQRFPSNIGSLNGMISTETNDNSGDKSNKHSADSLAKGAAQSREKGATVTGGTGVGVIGRASSSGNRLRSYSAAESMLASTSTAASALMSPTMSPSSPAVASPSSYLFARDEAIPAPRTCGVCFGVGMLRAFQFRERAEVTIELQIP